MKMDHEKELIAMEYPGRVLNIDNMIKSLGGLANISKVVSYNRKKRTLLVFVV